MRHRGGCADARKDLGTHGLGDRSGADAREFEGGDIGGVFGLLFGGEVATLGKGSDIGVYHSSVANCRRR
jgi:hypothetical protein